MIPDDLGTNLAIWVGIFALLLVLNTLRRVPTGFLVYSYLAQLFLNHWFGAMIHALPSWPFLDSSNTILGFKESTYAILAFAIGAIFFPVSVVSPEKSILQNPERLKEANDLCAIYFIIGLMSWVLSFSPIAQLPSATAIISAGKQMIVLVICLKSWLAWQGKNTKAFVCWVVAALIPPFLVLIFQGFLGYGIVILITILCFIGAFYRPLWRIVLFGLIALYCGLSVFVAYAAHREEIRSVIWSGQDLDARVSIVVDVLANIEPLDLTNAQSLNYIDGRLNQNELVGAGVVYTPRMIPFADGETISDAIMAIIPRALWPDKPISGGSGNYVSKYTGIQFSRGTSVGMGQVFEFFINFGTMGVLGGFLLLGAALKFMDNHIARSLHELDWHSLALWFLVGTGALQGEGSLAEMSMAMAGGAIFAKAISHFTKRRRLGLRPLRVRRPYS